MILTAIVSYQHSLTYLYIISLTDELTAEEKYFIDVKYSIETLQKDMVRLNTLITEKKGEHYKLEQSNTLLEKDFISALKVSKSL